MDYGEEHSRTYGHSRFGRAYARGETSITWIDSSDYSSAQFVCSIRLSFSVLVNLNSGAPICRWMDCRALPVVGRGAPGALRRPLGRRTGHQAPAANAP